MDPERPLRYNVVGHCAPFPRHIYMLFGKVDTTAIYETLLNNLSYAVPVSAIWAQNEISAG